MLSPSFSDTTAITKESMWLLISYREVLVIAWIRLVKRWLYLVIYFTRNLILVILLYNKVSINGVVCYFFTWIFISFMTYCTWHISNSWSLLFQISFSLPLTLLLSFALTENDTNHILSNALTLSPLST